MAPTVAIAGATGSLGSQITSALLLPQFRPGFRDVVILARSSSSKAQHLVAAGATLRLYSEDRLNEALEGVDVLVNAVGPDGHRFKEALVRCLPGSSVNLYFPSEFGVNHYLHDFAHDEWDAKKHHFRLAGELVPGIRVCRVYAGLFLEESIGPWFGFFTRQGRYEAVGSPDQRTSFTSMLDVAKAVAVLAAAPPQSVPEQVHLSGDRRSVAEIAAVMQQAGAGPVDVTSVPLAEYKAQVLAKPSPTPERYLRFLMAEGKIDHSDQGLGNQNHLVQGKVAAFKSMADLAKETHGRPWADAEGPPTEQT